MASRFLVFIYIGFLSLQVLTFIFNQPSLHCFYLNRLLMRGSIKDYNDDSRPALFVDGYNAIGRMQTNMKSNIFESSSEKMELARQKLIDDLLILHTVSGLYIELVFDAYRVSEFTDRQPEQVSDDFQIIFTNHGQSADGYIEQRFSQLQREGFTNMLVATDDQVLRTVAGSSGQGFWSIQKLREEMNIAHRQWITFENNLNEEANDASKGSLIHIDNHSKSTIEKYEKHLQQLPQYDRGKELQNTLQIDTYFAANSRSTLTSAVRPLTSEDIFTTTRTMEKTKEISNEALLMKEKLMKEKLVEPTKQQKKKMKKKQANKSKQNQGIKWKLSSQELQELENILASKKSKSSEPDLFKWEEDDHDDQYLFPTKKNNRFDKDKETDEEEDE
jgi:predicted RNA-binding protein with PIN domain